MGIVTGVIWRKEREKERKTPEAWGLHKKSPAECLVIGPKDRKREASERGAMKLNVREDRLNTPSVLIKDGGAAIREARLRARAEFPQRFSLHVFPFRRAVGPVRSDADSRALPPFQCRRALKLLPPPDSRPRQKPHR